VSAIVEDSTGQFRALYACSRDPVSAWVKHWASKLTSTSLRISERFTFANPSGEERPRDRGQPAQFETLTSLRLFPKC